MVEIVPLLLGGLRTVCRWNAVKDTQQRTRDSYISLDSGEKRRGQYTKYLHTVSRRYPANGSFRMRRNFGQW